jgi:hypothetical protein
VMCDETVFATWHPSWRITHYWLHKTADLLYW